MLAASLGLALPHSTPQPVVQSKERTRKWLAQEHGKGGGACSLGRSMTRRDAEEGSTRRGAAGDAVRG
jgi:hypothetical protein